jgi:hypothetical protein
VWVIEVVENPCNERQIESTIFLKRQIACVVKHNLRFIQAEKVFYDAAFNVVGNPAFDRSDAGSTELRQQNSVSAFERPELKHGFVLEIDQFMQSRGVQNGDSHARIIRYSAQDLPVDLHFGLPKVKIIEDLLW